MTVTALTVPALTVPALNDSALTVTVQNAALQNVVVQISVTLNAEIQSGSVQSAAPPIVMDAPVVRSYRDVMAATVVHCAVLRFVLVVLRFAPVVLHCVVACPLSKVVHFFAEEVQAPASLNHSFAVERVQFVHYRVSVSRPNLSLYLDPSAPDDFHQRLAAPV